MRCLCIFDFVHDFFFGCSQQFDTKETYDCLEVVPSNSFSKMLGEAVWIPVSKNWFSVFRNLNDISVPYLICS
jgi:hypothetical protein